MGILLLPLVLLSLLVVATLLALGVHIPILAMFLVVWVVPLSLLGLAVVLILVRANFQEKVQGHHLRQWEQEWGRFEE